MPHESAEARCTCGHLLDTHQHFRSGSDCGQCGKAVCPAFTPASGEPPPSGYAALLARVRGLFQRS